jgi:uncharacterized protein with ParB-like and HNH nuclease domain
MQEIRGDAKNIRNLLGGSKYSIDYYQREYRWGKKQVLELLTDLSNKFHENHMPSNERTAVEGYGHYFLGSIIISDKNGKRYIIDGQQRLTTLTLLLIHLYQRIDDENQKGLLADLIFSQKYGKKSFNLDVSERKYCMEALFSGRTFEENGHPESVGNIVNRYYDTGECLSKEMDDKTLPFFADWLIENVHLVEITAYSDADAYLIFETMNDRGLSLTPTDMLKGYLLANITDTEKRNEASQIWRDRVTALREFGKDEDADAIKSWLRSQHAQNTRERKQGAKPRDFDLIGTEFHRWVRSQKEDLFLNSSSAYAQFIKDDFEFYSRWYLRIRKAADTLTSGLETIHFNAQNNFTLQYPVLLSSLCRSDSEKELLRKLRIVAGYIDILIARRIWNWKGTSYSAMQYNMFQLVIRRIRGKTISQLIEILMQRLNSEEETFATNDRFSMHKMNGPQIHRMLARMADYIETRSGRPSIYDKLITGGKKGFEIEHIWANHPERHLDEFGHPADFYDYRNRIGGLLLLPKAFNASYGDIPYAEKREYYYGQNLLAQSLHENAYKHDPGFNKFIEKAGLKFRPHYEFKKADLDTRQELYGKLAEQIWNPENLLQDMAV